MTSRSYLSIAQGLLMLLKKEVSGEVHFAVAKCLLSLTRLLTDRVGLRAHPLTHNLADQPAGYSPSSEAYLFTNLCLLLFCGCLCVHVVFVCALIFCSNRKVIESSVGCFVIGT